MADTKARVKAQYLQQVVAQPTKQSDVKAKVDASSPTGIRQVKNAKQD